MPDVTTEAPKKTTEPYYEVFKEGKIKKVLLKDVLAPTDTWGAKPKIISLVGIKKIMDFEEIVEKRYEVNVVPTGDNNQQHVVTIWVGFRGDADSDNWGRGAGEASKYNTGKVDYGKDGKRTYVEHGQIDAQYRFAMADKRALGRAVLRLVRLHNVYSEFDAKSFLKGKPGSVEGTETDYDY